VFGKVLDVHTYLYYSTFLQKNKTAGLI